MSTPDDFRPDEGYARERDKSDPLRAFRDRFFLPDHAPGRPAVYLCGHSLGLQPRSAPAAVAREFAAWATRGIDGYFEGDAPWYTYQDRLRGPSARLAGARPDEVVVMNGLTVNLHLLMASFFRPTRDRWRVLMDGPPFPSDHYAVQSQLTHHGLDPVQDLILVSPRSGEHLVRPEDVEEVLDTRGHEVALVLLSGVHFLTGQCHDLPRLCTAARRRGCLVGLDLAHSAGNVPLHLHDWDVDFATWCGYKYLNAGPGAPAGVFVHARHGGRGAPPRLAGWWGNDPATRFRMHLEPTFVPHTGADGWQVSCPPVLALAPLLAALDLFDEAGLPALRAKSIALTAYFFYLLDRLPPGRFEVLTPRDPSARGCQVSLLALDRPRAIQKALQAEGVVCDFREPNVLRAAPVPLYNTFHDVWTFVNLLARTAGSS